MPKNAVKPEAAEPISETASSNPGGQNDLTGTTPYTEKTALGGPVPVVMGTGLMSCRVKLSGKVLQAAGLKPNDQIELISVGDGQILIRKIAELKPGLTWAKTTGMDRALDVLMAQTRAFEAEQRAAREQRYAYQEETEAEDEPESLNEAQISQEEL